MDIPVEIKTEIKIKNSALLNRIWRNKLVYMLILPPVACFIVD